MKRYVAEALRGQLAKAAAQGVPSVWPPSPALTLSALRSEMVSLVKKTLEEERETTSEAAPRLPDVMAEALESRLADETPGAPRHPPARVVTGVRGLLETGFRHDVVACDPCLPREMWVTRCGWRFGSAAHII